jgi:hypothetical protein
MSRFINKTSQSILTMVIWVLYLATPLVEILGFYLRNRMGLAGNVRLLLSLVNLFVDYFFVVIAIILLFWTKQVVGGYINLIQKRTMIFILITSLVFVILSRFLISAEDLNYPNYLYSKLGINYDNLLFMSNFTFGVLIFTVYVFQKNIAKLPLNFFKPEEGVEAKSLSEKFFQGFDKKIIPIYIPLFIISCLIIAASSFNLFFNVKPLLKESEISYEVKYGHQYKYALALKKFVPENGLVIHPPQGDAWPFIGNQPALRYFVFPRELVSGGLIKRQADLTNFKEAYFVEIDPEFKTSHWPEIDEQRRLISFDGGVSKVSYKTLNLVSNEAIKVYKVGF